MVLCRSNLFAALENSQFKPILDVMWLSLINSEHLFGSKQIIRYKWILFYVNFKCDGLGLM